MGLRAKALYGGSAVFGGASGAAIMSAAGAGAATALVGGGAFAMAAVAAIQAYLTHRDAQALKASLAEAQSEIGNLLERQAGWEAKLGEIERRTIESPALVWRAATADIQVLSALVSDLARSVAEHEQRLGPLAAPAAAPAIPAQPEAVPAPSPDWFEDEAELGFTADAPVLAEPPSPAVISELKLTLASALASERLELCLQPIVTLPQRKTHGYDASLRLKGEGDEFQTEADLRRIAAATGMEHELDRMLIDRVAQVLRVLRARNRQIGAICSISAKSLLDPGFRSAIERIGRSDSALAASIAIEAGDLEFRALGARGVEAFREIADLGVKPGIGRLQDLRIDAAMLASAKIAHLRIAAEALSGSHGGLAPQGDIHPADLPTFLQRKGIELIVSDVATEQMVPDLLDLSVTLAVGPLFGPSRPVRPEVLAPKSIPAEITGEAASPQAPAVPTPAAARTRQTFRSMLRRA